MIGYKYNAEQLKDLFFTMVKDGIGHGNYKHTVEVADFWHKMLTGKNHQDFIVKLRKSESQNQKEQRVRVYKSRTKYVLSRIRTQIKKSDRVDYAVDKIQYQEKEKEAELIKRLECFNGNRNAKEYINHKFREYNEKDPNAFLVVNFHDYDPTKTKAYTYPKVIPSCDVFNFEYFNGILQYLVFTEKITVQVEGVFDKEAVKYFMLAPDITITLQEVIEGQSFGEDDQIVNVDGRSYIYQTFDTKSKQVPAIRIGYIEDPETNGETMQSIYYPAKEILEDHIQKKSELDTTLLLHGIAQKFAYVPQCDYEHDDLGKCDNGHYSCGTKCKVCNGTGKKQFHTSTQDIVTLQIPFNETFLPEHFIDLSKLIHYAEIPEHIIKMHREIVDQLERDVSTSLFNVDVFKQEFNGQKTAEEIRSRNDALNNVLFEYSVAKARKYQFVVNQTAIFMDQDEGLYLNFKPSTDFKLDTLDDLLGQFSMSEGAPKPVRDRILDKIYQKQNQDSPELIMKINARDKFRPFSHMTEVERMNALDMIDDEHPSKVLWLNFDLIFCEIENADTLEIDDRIKTKTKFWEIKDYQIQKSILDKVVERYKNTNQSTIREAVIE